MKNYIFYIIGTIIFLSGCTSDNPAVVERREDIYYGKSGVVKLVTLRESISLEQLADKYEVSVDAVSKANGLSPSSKLIVGQVVKVPITSSYQFEEKLYSQPDDHIEEVPLSDDDSYSNQMEKNSDGDVKGGGYLGSIKTTPTEVENYNEINEERKDNVDAQEVPISKNLNFKFPTPLNLPEFIWPLNGKVISPYGQSEKGFNEGINIAAPAGTSVKAIADGSVIFTGKEPNVYGNLIIIKHEGGFLSAYAHNGMILIKKGAKISQSDVIAKVGTTGAVSSPQLHFSMRKNKETINPEQDYRN